MLNLESRHKGYDCYDQIIQSILHYIDAPEYFPLMYSNYFGFDFDYENDGLIGNRIYLNRKRDLLYEIAELKREYNIFTSLDTFIADLKLEEKNERPIIGHVDSFYIPWDKFYHKTHGPHAILFLEANEEEGYIYCSDRYYSKKIERLSISLINDSVMTGYTKVESLRVGRDFKKRECYDLLLSHVNDLINENYEEKILKFSKYLAKNLDIKKEIDGYENPQRAPIIVAFNYIGYCRGVYCHALKYVRDKYRDYDLNYFIDKLEMADIKWRNISMILLKYATLPTESFDVSRLISVLERIKELEVTIIKELSEYLNGELKVIASNRIDDIPYHWEANFKPAKFINLDIATHFDNLAYSIGVENRAKASYTFDEFCVIKIPVNGFLSYNNEKIKVNIGTGALYDNFGCNNQTIPVPEGRYTDLLVVASSQFGHRKDDIKLIYTDGTVGYEELRVSDWRVDPIYGEYLIYNAFSYRVVNETKSTPQGNCHLYLQRIQLNPNKVLSEIILPFHPNIHIFGMGLCGV